MKWSGGTIVARATVHGFRQVEACTSEELREATRGYRLFDLDDYWASRHPEFFGMTIDLEGEAWLDTAIEPAVRSRGESWIVLDTDEARASWLTPGPREPRPRRSDSTKRGATQK